VVKPLWQEFHWSLPLSRVIAQALEVNHQHIVLLEDVLSKLHLLGWNVDLTYGGGRSHAQPFLHQSSGELHLLRSFESDYFVKERSF